MPAASSASPSSSASEPSLPPAHAAPAATGAPSAALVRSILLLSVAAFASSISMRICDPMLPRLAEQFGVDLTAVSAVVTWFAVGYGALQLLWGPIGDRVGKFRLCMWATATAALASLGCALAPDLFWLTMARLAAGGVAAAIIPLSLAWIGDVVAFEYRQPVLARFMAGSIMGVVSGQLVGGLLADTLGWRSAFAALSVVFIAAAALLARELPTVRRLTAAAKNASPEHAQARPRGTLAQNYLAVLRDSWVRQMLTLVGLEGLLVFGPLALIPASLHERLALPVWATGLIASGFALGGLAYTSIARRLIARLGEQGLAITGAGLLAVGMPLMAVGSVWPVCFAGCLIMGLGFYSMHNTMQAHGTQMAPRQRGLGVGLFAFCFFAGQSSGVALAAQLVARVGFKPVFLGCAVAIALLGAAFRMALTRRHRRHGHHRQAVSH
jgi:MFS transporter, YNFM family, putative membrane transport protein